MEVISMDSPMTCLSPCDLTVTVTNEIIYNGTLVERYARDRAKLIGEDFEIILMNGTVKQIFKYSLVILLGLLFSVDYSELTMSHIICYLFYNRDHFNLEDVGIDQIRFIHLGKPYTIRDVRLLLISTVNLRSFNTIQLLVSPQHQQVYNHFNIESYFRNGTMRPPKWIKWRGDIEPLASQSPSQKKRRSRLISALARVFGS